MNVRHIYATAEVAGIAEEMGSFLSDADAAVFDAKGGFYASALLGQDGGSVMLVVDATDVAEPEVITLTLSARRGALVDPSKLDRVVKLFHETLQGT